MYFFSKTAVFIKFVVPLTIVNGDSSLTIVNDDPLLMIVNLFINEKKFKNDSFFKQSYKKTIADRFIKTIVIHFLKVQNETIKNV